MSNINEIKEMLDKLNEELETLRVENSELKLRLAKYENVVTNSNTDDLMLEDVYQKVSNNDFRGRRPGNRWHAGFLRLIDSGYKTLGDCRGLSLYDIVNLPQVGPDAAAFVIVVLEHYDVIKVGDFCISKVTKSHQNYRRFEKLIANYRENLRF